MKTSAVCAKCIQTNPLQARQPFDVDFYEDGVANVTCHLGHKTIMLINNAKTEILLNSAADALASGFTYEAVASANTALERFYEFCLRVFFWSRKTSRGEFEKFFKGMSNRSEIQLGAFMLFHEMELRLSFKPSEDIASFRNAVLHKGTIPTVAEAEKFCNSVYGAIASIQKPLVGKFGMELIAHTIHHEALENQKHVPKGLEFTTADILTVFKLASVANASSFTDAASGYAQARAHQLSNG